MIFILNLSNLREQNPSGNLILEELNFESNIIRRFEGNLYKNTFDTKSKVVLSTKDSCFAFPLRNYKEINLMSDEK